MLDMLDCNKCGQTKDVCAHIAGEYERLKRLDENVKKMIKDLSVAIGVDSIVNKYNEFDRKAYEHFLELLESLYDA